MGELGALFNPGMRHELVERRALAARREEEGNARDGDLLRGVGTMQVDPLPAGGCRVTWANDLRLPFGVVGRAGWLIAKPIAQLALGASLRRLARQLTAGVLPLRPATS